MEKDKGEPPEDIFWGMDGPEIDDEIKRLLKNFSIKQILDSIGMDEINVYLREKKIRKLKNK